MVTRLSDLILNRGGMAMGEQSQTVTKYNNPTMRTAASQSATAPNRLATAPQQMPGLSFDNANQNTRGAAESVANPAIAESLRLSLARQQQLAQTPYGSQSLGDRRARARAIQSNQADVTSGLGAVGMMRNSQVTAEGNRISAEEGILNRRLAEAGGTERTAMSEAAADGRALLTSATNRFTAGLQGDSMVEAERVRGQNAIDLRGTLTPGQERGMQIFSEMDQVMGASGDGVGLAAMRGAQANTLLTGQPFNAGPAPEGRSKVELGMNKYEVANSVADQEFALARIRENPTENGIMPDEVDAAVQAISEGVSLAQLPAYLNQQRQLAIAQMSGEQQTAADAKTQQDEAKAYRASVEQQRRDLQRRGVPMSDEQYQQLLLRDYTPAGGLGN